MQQKLEYREPLKHSGPADFWKLQALFLPEKNGTQDLDEKNPWGFTQPEGENQIRYFVAVEENDFLESFDFSGGVFNPGAIPNYPTFDKYTGGSVTRALSRAGQKAKKMILNEKEEVRENKTILIVSGLVNQREVRGNFSSWDTPVLLPEDGALVDKVIDIKARGVLFVPKEAILPNQG